MITMEMKMLLQNVQRRQGVAAKGLQERERVACWEADIGTRSLLLTSGQQELGQEEEEVEAGASG